MPGVVVLDKEMAQFYMKDMTTAVQRVEYVAGELNCEPTTIHIAFQLFFFCIQTRVILFNKVWVYFFIAKFFNAQKKKTIIKC